VFLVTVFAAYSMGLARALTITIDDTVDNLVVTSDSPNTTVVISTDADGTEHATIRDPFLTTFALPATTTALFAVLAEGPPNAAGLSPVSDDLELALGIPSPEETAHPVGFLFTSDGDAGSLGTVNRLNSGFADCQPETGAPVDLAFIMFSRVGGDHPIVNVISDLDTPVSEPSTLALLCLAFTRIVLASARRLTG